MAKNEEFNLEFVEIDDSGPISVENANIALMGEDALMPPPSDDEEDDPEQSILDVAIKQIARSIDASRFMHILCPRCGKEFEKVTHWHRHLINSHFFYNFKLLPVTLTSDEEHYKCNNCEKSYHKTDYRKILYHCFTHMPFNCLYKCSICEKTMLPPEQQMHQHIKKHMQMHLLKAKADKKVFKAKKFHLNNKTKFDKHLLYACPSCPTQFREESKWLQHIETDHQIITPDKLNFSLHYQYEEDDEDMKKGPAATATTTCNACGFTIVISNSNDNDTETHQSKIKHYITFHMGFKAFRCAVCKMSFSQQGEMKMHMYLLHCKNLLTINEDDEEDGISALVDNVPLTYEVHTKFMNSDGLKFDQHMFFNCPMCDIRFKELADFNAHITENHDFFKKPQLVFEFAAIKGEEKAYCLTCNRDFVYKGARCLWVHQLRHTPYQSFGCSICDEKFFVLHLLRGHFRNVHHSKDGTISMESSKKRKGGKRVA